MSKILFAIATAILIWGAIQNVKFYGAVSSVGSMSMNGFYLLAVAVYVAAAAAELIWSSRTK